MAWSELRRALIEVIEGVPGLVRIDAFEPEAVDPMGPYVYVIYLSGSRENRGGITVCKHVCNVRVCVPWQDPAAAEAMIAPYVNLIPQHIDAFCQLNGALKNGMVKLASGDALVAGFQVIGGVQFLALDIKVEITEKGPASREPGVIGEV